MSKMEEVAAEDLRKVLLFIAQLLEYPEEEWLRDEAVGQFPGQLEDAGVSLPLQRFWRSLQAQTLAECCRRYVDTFDFSGKTTLYLTYPAYGEERERGQALLKLKTIYARAGFETITDELPDYLPLVLEFASVAPLAVVRPLLEELRPSVAALGQALVEIGSPYADVLAACLAVVDRIVKSADETALNVGGGQG